jgi:hypothetical protein
MPRPEMRTSNGELVRGDICGDHGTIRSQAHWVRRLEGWPLPLRESRQGLLKRFDAYFLLMFSIKIETHVFRP